MPAVYVDCFGGKSNFGIRQGITVVGCSCIEHNG